jgi:two-component system chemotaxis response regulator CheY
MALNILVVDDSHLTRKAIKRIIGMTGLDVDKILEAENGVEALNVLDDTKVDLVLADLNMPEMGGIEMINKMKTDEATKTIPVVIVTTESSMTRIKELLEQGVKDYLHKPFAPEEFRQLFIVLWRKCMIGIESYLTEALTKAVEKMGFLTVMPMEEDMAIPEKTILSEMNFSGPRSGTIQILAGSDFAKVLAKNISADDETDDEACLDAMKELSNVTCGLLLPMLADSSEDVFDVTVPKIIYGENSSQWREFTADQNSHVFNVEGYMVTARFTCK